MEEVDLQSGDMEPVSPVALALGGFLIFGIVILFTTVGGRSKPTRQTSQATTQREHVWRRPPPAPSDPGPQNHVPAAAQKRLLEISSAAVVESLTRGTLRYNAVPESVRLSNVAFHFRPSTRGPGAFSLRGRVDWTDSRPEMGGREIAGEFIVTVVDGQVIDTRVRREDDHTMFGR